MGQRFTDGKNRLQEPSRLSWRSVAVLLGVAVLYLLFRNLPWLFVSFAGFWNFVLVGALVVPLVLAHTLVRATGAALIAVGFILVDHIIWVALANPGVFDALYFPVIALSVAGLLELAHAGVGRSRWAWWRSYLGGLIAFLAVVTAIESQAPDGLGIVLAYGLPAALVMIASIFMIRVVGGLLDSVGAHGTPALADRTGSGDAPADADPA